MATFAEKVSYMDTLFSMSKEGKSEYCCNVIRIGQILPIPGKDLIGQTLVNGESIVIRKDQVKEGDVLLYAGNETQLAPAFLKANCLYSEPSMNADKDRKGYFGKNGRVRMVRLAAPASVRERLMPMTVLYSGPVRNMYEGIDFEADIWRDEFLARMKGDTKRLGLERSEPLCLHHRVPREGVCIRIRQDSYAECFKLKALAFLDKEAKEIDAGNVDMEMAEGV